MDISGRTIWQQASGDADREYSGWCLKWDVILNGPGGAGRWPDCRQRLREAKTSERKLTDLSRFAEKMTDGDVVVLRSGTSRVVAVGQAVGPYEWRDEFGDVDGWDLQHVRRVRWLWNCSEHPKKFGVFALKQGDTTQELKRGPGPVREWLDALTIHPEAFERQLAELPATADGRSVTVDEMSQFLFDHGVASLSITTLMSEISELVRIAKWYWRTSTPSEHETVAYLVVPLLRALGWTPQRMAVEWNHVDVALFSQLPRVDQSLRVVVEAKRMGKSCLTAVSQAERYARDKDDCNRLIVTDGLRYGVYVRKERRFRLHAYMNLTRLRRSYPVFECGGAESALLAMAPEWMPDTPS